jgi:hypothetical protein
MVSESWMENYSDMEFVNSKKDTKLPLAPKTKNNVVAIQTPFNFLKRKDVRLLLTAREFVKDYNRLCEEKERALDIKVVNVAINNSSTEALILKALSNIQDGLHINDIIIRLEKLGWVSESKYHKYDLVRKTLSDNYFMFQRIAPATFKLREGFRGRPPEKTQPVIRHKTKSNKLTSLEDIVVWCAKKQNSNTYPGSVYYALRQCGYRCAYTSIYKIMQGKNFIKKGFWYRLNAHKDAKITTSISKK